MRARKQNTPNKNKKQKQNIPHKSTQTDIHKPHETKRNTNTYKKTYTNMHSFNEGNKMGSNHATNTKTKINQ